jgi:hypothetical protein
MKRKPKDWAKVQAELEELKSAPPPAATASANDPNPGEHADSETPAIRKTNE